MTGVAHTIAAKLTAGLAPTRLEVVDESARHAGHAGAREGGESHFQVTVVSAAFVGLGRVARQRLVHGLLAEELSGPVHALSLAAVAPAEEPTATLAGGRPRRGGPVDRRPGVTKAPPGSNTDP
ncbi:MAG: BolA family protein [Caulobacteraceae bacterium]